MAEKLFREDFNLSIPCTPVKAAQPSKIKKYKEQVW